MFHNLEVIEERICLSVRKRSGTVLSVSDLATGKWYLPDDGVVRRNFVHKNYPFYVVVAYDGRLSSYESESLGEVSEEEGDHLVAWLYGDFPLTSRIEHTISERIEEDTRLYGAILQGRFMAGSHYGDGEFDTPLGFIHRSVGGRLALSSDKHDEWMRHYQETGIVGCCLGAVVEYASDR